MKKTRKIFALMMVLSMIMPGALLGTTVSAQPDFYSIKTFNTDTDGVVVTKAEESSYIWNTVNSYWTSTAPNTWLPSTGGTDILISNQEAPVGYLRTDISRGLNDADPPAETGYVKSNIDTTVSSEPFHNLNNTSTDKTILEVKAAYSVYAPIISLFALTNGTTVTQPLIRMHMDEQKFYTNGAGTTNFFSRSSFAKDALRRNWHHYYFVLDGNTFRMFVDGEEMGKGSNLYYDYDNPSGVTAFLYDGVTIDDVTINATGVRHSGMAYGNDNMYIDDQIIQKFENMKLNINPFEGDKAQDVPVDKLSYLLDFNTLIDSATLSTITVSKDNGGGAATVSDVNAVLDDIDKSKLILTFPAALDNATEYTINFSGLKDMFNSPSPANIVFNTIDLNTPSLVASYPVSGAIDFPLHSQKLTVAFDKYIDAATLTPANIWLQSSEGETVGVKDIKTLKQTHIPPAADNADNATVTIASFLPNGTLKANTEYTIMFSENIKTETTNTSIKFGDRAKVKFTTSDTAYEYLIAFDNNPTLGNQAPYLVEMSPEVIAADDTANGYLWAASYSVFDSAVLIGTGTYEQKPDSTKAFGAIGGAYFAARNSVSNVGNSRDMIYKFPTDIKNIKAERSYREGNTTNAGTHTYSFSESKDSGYTDFLDAGVTTTKGKRFTNSNYIYSDEIATGIPEDSQYLKIKFGTRSDISAGNVSLWANLLVYVHLNEIADDAPTALISSTPAAGVTDAPADTTQITLKFDNLINAGTIKPESFTVSGNTVKTAVPTADYKGVILTLNSAIGTRTNVTVSAPGLEDAYGNDIAMTPISFTTQPGFLLGGRIDGENAKATVKVDTADNYSFTLIAASYDKVTGVLTDVVALPFVNQALVAGEQELTIGAFAPNTTTDNVSYFAWDSLGNMMPLE